MNAPRLSARHLGALTLPDHCPRCWWVQAQLEWRMPFSGFPGIFSSIDAYTKKITEAYFEEHGRMPEWVPPGAQLACPHWSKFASHDEATGISLCGCPDEMVRLADGRLGIFDYKTARHTQRQGEMLALYEAQLRVYAWLAERLGYGETGRLALIYCEPQTDEQPRSRLRGLTSCEGFAMQFVAHVVPVAIDPSTVPTLLRRARELLDLTEPPSERNTCKNCMRVGGLLDLLRPMKFLELSVCDPVE